MRATPQTESRFRSEESGKLVATDGGGMIASSPFGPLPAFASMS